MRISTARIGPGATKAMRLLFTAGIGITMLGAALQVAQGLGHIAAVPLFAGTTIFGVLSKIGGVAMIGGIVCGAVRAPRVTAADTAAARVDANRAPGSPAVRPAAGPIRPKRVRPAFAAPLAN